MRLNRAPLNFGGDPGVVFASLARLGHAGCPYPQPLAAARRALTKAQDSTDPDNGGFLRPEAALGVVIITAQDDCSVPADSDLFDPRQMTLADPYGRPGPYRCAEFGWLCSGAKPPHELPLGSDSLALGACVPAEVAGKLTPVADFVQFLHGLKSNPDNIMVSLIAGPVEPVGIAVSEGEPVLGSSCVGADGETATPGVRLKALTNSFGPNGFVFPACAKDLRLASVGFAESLPVGRPPLCVPAAVTDVSATNCRVTQTQIDGNGVESRWELPACDADRTVLPCWQPADNAAACLHVKGTPIAIYREASCMPYCWDGEARTMDVSCLASCR